MGTLVALEWAMVKSFLFLEFNSGDGSSYKDQ